MKVRYAVIGLLAMVLSVIGIIAWDAVPGNNHGAEPEEVMFQYDAEQSTSSDPFAAQENPPYSAYYW
ncbi:MAG: hypothetical protein ACOX6U_05020 [Oscillospiraceae bacterium]|jgi:hypothetical protein